MSVGAHDIRPHQAAGASLSHIGNKRIVTWSEDEGWTFEAEWWRAPFRRRLAAARKAKDWSQERTAQEMHLIAERHDGASASVRSLITMISNWERKVYATSLRNLHLASEALGLDVQAFGVPVDPDFHWPPPRARGRRQSGQADPKRARCA